jgi:hypothetical protein
MRRIVVSVCVAILACVGASCFTVAASAHQSSRTVIAQASASPPPLGTKFAGTSPTTSPQRMAGKVLGLIALLVVLVLFSEGFGILGGRIRNLSSRPTQPPG